MVFMGSKSSIVKGSKGSECSKIYVVKERSYGYLKAKE